MAGKRKKYWIGYVPGDCQLCMSPIEGEFVDGVTTQGTWAIMCIPCHQEWGIGLGAGKGQKYNAETKELISC